MFGFVLPNNEELSDAEKDRYQQVYCGQCHTLGNRSGQRTRFTLSHDMTFVALLLMSLYEPSEERHETGCPVHPIKQQVWVTNEYVGYAADMTVALAYHKCIDDWNDDRSLPARTYAELIRKQYERVSVSWPRQCAALEQGMRAIAEAEKQETELAKADEGETNPDAVANIFGGVMANLVVVRDDVWAPTLREFGWHLGRFIYMMDAAYDLDDDLKRGNYNPFAKRGLSRNDIHDVLMMYIGSATAVFEKLPLEQDVNILRNVLYSGVWIKYNEYLKKKHEGVERDEEHAEENCSDDEHGERKAHEAADGKIGANA